jgi:signal recognition particle receptor subunit beta
MGTFNRDTHEVHAKIVFYGASGSGTTTNLRFIQRKLRSEHRGELRTLTPREGASETYEVLPVDLGSVRGFHTSFHLYTVPAGQKHAPVRRKLLEGVDAVVFVADLRSERHEATLASLKELESYLRSYGRSVEDIVLLLQYNHRDSVEENAVEQLHHAIWVDPNAAFEAVASQGTGVLGTLTTLSKLILARLRREADQQNSREIGAGEFAVAVEDDDVVLADETSPRLNLGPEKGFRVESGGPVSGTDREIRIPIALIDEGTGRRIGFSLRVNLDLD